MNNNETMQTALDLVYLLSCAANEEKPDPERCARMDLAEIFKMAFRHSLTVTAAFALEQVVSLPEDFREEKYKAIRRLSLFDIDRDSIFNSFEQQKIWYLPLKGAVLKDCYPKKSMREMSDNDILCDSKRMADVKKIMEGLGYVCENYGTDHHDSYKKLSLIEFEMHRSLFYSVRYPEWFAYFENIRDRLIRDEGKQYGYHMTNEDFYIFLICHLRKHYRHAGTGLRSLLDIYLFLKKFQGGMNSGYIDAEFQKLDMTGFERDIRQLSQKLFSGQTLSEDEQRELSFVVDSNTHGSLENAITLRLNNDDSGKAKRKYAMNRLFPSYEEAKKYHPLVNRHKSLYPFLIVYRPVKGVLFKRKQMFGEIKKLKNFKKKDGGKHDE